MAVVENSIDSEKFTFKLKLKLNLNYQAIISKLINESKFD